MLMSRRRQRALDRPTDIEASGQAVLAQTDSGSPVAQAQRLAVIRQQSSAPRIAKLNRTRNPAAILWRVWAIVVDAVESMARRWARSDIRQKGGEIVPPTLTDHDASLSVVLAIRIRWAGTAALLHQLPCAVLDRICAAVAVLQLRGAFSFSAAARSGAALPKRLQVGARLVAALAAASKSALVSAALRQLGQHGQAAIDAADHILRLHRHNADYTPVCINGRGLTDAIS